MYDQLAAGVYTGYYAGYYHPLNKRKKNPQEIIRKILMGGRGKSEHKADVDVAAFLAMEKEFESKRRGGN